MVEKIFMNNNTENGKAIREMEALCRLAYEDRIRTGMLAAPVKNKVLLRAAECLLEQESPILAANKIDIENAKEKGMPEGLIDRLTLDHARLEGMADGLRQVAGLDDPIGEVLSMKKRPNGLQIGRKRVPIGVVGMIYESRPNVTSDAFALCFKTGNCVILKGGSDCIHSNIAIVDALKIALREYEIPEGALGLITDTNRETTSAFMKMDQYVNVLIPRGGAGLIKSVVHNASIPVIETGTGNCHVFVDESADQEMAINIIRNAKTQRIGVCNACESLIIHSRIAEEFLPKLYEALEPFHVQMRADARAMKALAGVMPGGDGDHGSDQPLVIAANEQDWGMEYLDYILSVRVLDSVEEAIDHINHYNTSHSETIVTEDYHHAMKFLDEIDSACVYVNASTRFSDGNEFGFGAEIGISTQKLHARGPMGLEALTSYKYIIFGNGQIR